MTPSAKSNLVSTALEDLQTLAEDIETVAEELRTLRATRNAAILICVREGMSERRVAEAAGVSGVYVHKLKQGAKS